MAATEPRWKELVRWVASPPPPASEPRDLPRHELALLRARQILGALTRDLMEGGLTLRTTSLVYTTLLSIVPLLAFAFAVLQGFGVHDQLEPVLLRFLEPLGPRSQEFTNRIIESVGNIEVGVLGAVGLGFLMFTVGSLVYKIESGFNYIWKVRRHRHWPRSLGGYLSVILGGPILLFTATGMADAVMEHQIVQALAAHKPFRTLLALFGQLLPTVLVIAAAMIIYRLIPNTRVSFSAALAGGTVAGLLWQACGWAFGTFIGTSTRYTAIYSGFAIGLVFMIWLYVTWLILLVGGRLAFYVQNPHYMDQADPDAPFTGPVRELAGLTVLCLVWEAFLRDDRPWTAPELEARLALPGQPLDSLLADLEGAGLIAATRADPHAYLPARDPQRVSVKEALDSIHRRSGGKDRITGHRIRTHPGAEAVLERIEKGLQRELEGITLVSLLEDGDPPAGSSRRAAGVSGQEAG